MSHNARPKIWIRPNRRALVPGLVLCAFAIILGVTWVTGLFGADSPWLHGAGWFLIVIGAATFAVSAPLVTRPRVAYRDRSLLLYLRMGAPLAVPLDVVEAFFQGTGPSMLPGDRARPRKTANVVIRVAERANEFRERDVAPALGEWRDGYITIRGTWCEPITEELLRKLNARLADVKRRTGLLGESA